MGRRGNSFHNLIFWAAASTAFFLLAQFEWRTTNHGALASPSNHHLVSLVPTASQKRLEGFCGQFWRSSYTNYHHNIVAGLAPPKYVVSLGADVGLADRLVGTLSIFYYALLSGRAFQIATYPGVVDLREALEPAHIDWSREEVDDRVIENIKLDYKGIRHNLPDDRPLPAGVDSSQYWPMYGLGTTVTDLLLQGDIRRNPVGHENVTTVVVTSNRGRVWALFDNPHAKQALQDMGLRPDTAIPCAFWFLFKPHQEVRAMYKDTWAVMSDPSILKIGVQIRLGDHMFIGNNTAIPTWDSAEPYFACAQEIGKTRALPGQRVVYYLISDSLAMRRLAKARLGAQLLTDVETSTAHVACNSGTCAPNQQGLALRYAVGDLITFSMADVHVYSRESGFGRIGAWMSLHWHQHYEIDVSGPQRGYRSCGLDSYDALRENARTWSGVR